MTGQDYERIADTIHKYLGEILRPIDARLKTLEREVDDLRANGVEYKGVYQKAMTYQKGDILTYSGSAWICLKDGTTEAPGDSREWQLMVKCGRDAR